MLRDKKINIIEEKVVGIHARHLKMAQMSKDELKQVVNFNRRVIKLANFVTSSEYPLGRYSFNKSWSLFWARIRFLWLFWIMFRMIMFLLFQSCEYHQLRYYLLDWTTFYPPTRRVGLIRSYISLCVFQLALKRSILFRKTATKAFDPSLFLFLCRIPKKEDRKTSHLSDQVEPTMMSPVVKQLQGDKENVHRDRRQSMYPAIRRFSQLEPVTSHFGANRLVLRDRAHWLCISEKLRKHQRRILVDTAPVGLVIIFASAFRLAFTHQVDAGCAGPMPGFVRVIGTLEVMFCLTEALISTLGMMLHCQLVEADLKQQIYRIRTDLDLVITRLGPAKLTPIAPTSVGHVDDHKHPTNQIRALRQAKSSRKQTATKPAVLSVDLNDDLIAQCQLDIKRNQSFWSSSWSSMLSGSERAMQTSTRKAHPLGEPTDGDRNGDRHGDHDDDHQPTGEDLTLDPEKRFYYYPSRPVMSSVDKVNGQGPSTTDYDDQKEMAEAQRKVVQMLSCLDGHKALVAFQGNSLYIWVASCLTFVPLLAGVRRMSSEERVAITLYLTISMLAFVTCMRFTVVCASINHNVSIIIRWTSHYAKPHLTHSTSQANQLAALIFRTCSSHHGRPLVRRWNKVFMIWYSPNRCAFRVLGLLDMTYVNILKVSWPSLVWLSQLLTHLYI